MSRGHRFFDHTADVGVEVWAPTLRGLFAEGSRALCELICDTRTVRPRLARRIAVTGSGLDDLLVRWLSEVLFLHETRGLVFSNCTLQAIDRSRFRAVGVARGERFQPDRHRVRREVKAITYHQLALVRRGGRWRVRIIFDV